MLEAIRKFVLERGRDPHQSRRLIVEENGSGHAPNNSDVPPGLAEPELEGSSGLAVRDKSNGSTPPKGTASSSSRTGPATLFSMLLRLPA